MEPGSIKDEGKGQGKYTALLLDKTQAPENFATYGLRHTKDTLSLSPLGKWLHLLRRAQLVTAVEVRCSRASQTTQTRSTHKYQTDTAERAQNGGIITGQKASK